MAWSPEEPGQPAPYRGASPWLHAVRDVFTGNKFSAIKCMELEGVSLGILKDAQALWLRLKWPSGGSVAVRMVYTPNDGFFIDSCSEHPEYIEYSCSSSIGKFRVRVEVTNRERPLVHFTTCLTPEEELNIPFWPSDAYPMDAGGDPFKTRGTVYAAQRGYATAFIFASLTEPCSGSLLYLQDLTSLNDYCRQTGTVPDTRMGGSWPELGYTPPIAERKPLIPGQEVIISDGYLRLDSSVPGNQSEAARIFLEMLSEIYLALPRPDVVYRDWPRRAERALADLAESPECTTKVNGRRYLNGYVGTGNRRPESLVQLTVLTAMLEYADWAGGGVPLADEIAGGLSAFYDHNIGSVLRYPESEREKEASDVDEKKPWEVDSWYLYHPLVNIARIARRGNADARRLLEDSLEYAVKVARHFEYRWPILFDARTLEVIRRSMLVEGEEVLGETDVAGLYAYLMYVAWETLGDDSYLDEAKQALAQLMNMRFNMGYQFNNTAWTANAAMHMWRRTGDKAYAGLGYMAIASIFQNIMLWECNYGHAEKYSTFFGITPLRQGFYLAIYEEYEVFAAFHEYLTLAEDLVPESIRLLLAEYCKYALSRDWCYYPSELPVSAVAGEPRNGKIDRDLSIPLEDIYQGWEAAGQVGQEVYGAGAPMVFTIRSYHKIEGVPFTVYCDYPIFQVESQPGDGTLAFRIRGSERCKTRLRLIPRYGTVLPGVALRCWAAACHEELPGTPEPEGHIEYSLPGNCRVEIRFQPGP